MRSVMSLQWSWWSNVCRISLSTLHHVHSKIAVREKQKQGKWWMCSCLGRRRETFTSTRRLRTTGTSRTSALILRTQRLHFDPRTDYTFSSSRCLKWTCVIDGVFTLHQSHRRYFLFPSLCHRCLQCHCWLLIHHPGAVLGFHVFCSSRMCVLFCTCHTTQFSRHPQPKQWRPVVDHY